MENSRICTFPIADDRLMGRVQGFPFSADASANPEVKLSTLFDNDDLTSRGALVKQWAENIVEKLVNAAAKSVAYAGDKSKGWQSELEG